MSGMPGVTQKCRLTFSVSPGRGQSVKMGHVALNWCGESANFIKKALLMRKQAKPFRGGHAALSQRHEWKGRQRRREALCPALL